MDGLRRSARLSPNGRNPPTNSQSHNQFARQSSRYSSTSTSSYPSPDNDVNQAVLAQSQSQPSLNGPYLSVVAMGSSHMSAPLPSPSTSDMNSFFGRSHSQPNTYSSGLNGQQQELGLNRAGSQFQQQQAGLPSQQHHNSISQPGGAGQNNGQGGFPPDFNLLAEAAKRAQMACLMRDLSDVSL